MAPIKAETISGKTKPQASPPQLPPPHLQFRTEDTIWLPAARWNTSHRENTFIGPTWPLPSGSWTAQKTLQFGKRCQAVSDLVVHFGSGLVPIMPKRRRSQSESGNDLSTSSIDVSLGRDNSNGIITGANYGTNNIHNYAANTNPPCQLPDRDACHRSFSYSAMNDRQSDVQKAYRGTCEWLTSHASYLSWQQQSTALLWIKGHPGSGKSTLLRYALKAAKLKSQSEPKVAIASHFFYARGSDLQKNLEGLVFSLIHELLPQDLAYWDILTNRFAKNVQSRGPFGEGWLWHIDDLQDILRDLTLSISRHRTLHLFVDAVDEAGEKLSHDVAELLEELVFDSKKSNGSLKICFTCRHWPNILVDTDLQIIVERSNSDDIAMFAREKIRKAGISAQIAGDVEQRLTSKANGIFQWIVLVLDQVVDLSRKGQNRVSIFAEIDRLPPELDKLYLQLLETITRDDHMNETRDRSLRLFRWLCYTKRALNVKEMPYVLALDPAKRFQAIADVVMDPAYPENVNLSVKHLSRGLAEITKSKKVQLVHQSVTDYMVRQGLSVLEMNPLKSSFEESCKFLYGCCMQYMTLTMSDLLHPAPGDYASYREKNSFGDYCIRFWIAHALQLQDFGELDSEAFLTHIPTLQTWLLLHSQVLRFSEYPQLKRKGATLAHLVACFGLEGIFDAIHQRVGGEYPVIFNWDVCDEEGLTPLLYAAESGHLRLVRQLIENARVEVNAASIKRVGVLELAASGGHWDVVRYILQSCPQVVVSIETGQKNRSAIYQAAVAQEYDTLSLLLKSSCRIVRSTPTFFRPERRSTEGFTDACLETLMPAIALHEDSRLIDVLLESDVLDMDHLRSSASQQRRLIDLTIIHGSVQFLRRLVDDYAFTIPDYAVFLAVKHKQGPVMQMLLDRMKATINEVIHIPYQTQFPISYAPPLFIAAYYGNAAFMTSLITEYKADVNITYSKRQALSIAFEAGNVATAEVLLDLGFDVETEWHRIIKDFDILPTKKLPMMRMLLDRKASSKMKDGNGHTSLSNFNCLLPIYLVKSERKLHAPVERSALIEVAELLVQRDAGATDVLPLQNACFPSSVCKTWDSASQPTKDLYQEIREIVLRGPIKSDQTANDHEKTIADEQGAVTMDIPAVSLAQRCRTKQEPSSDKNGRALMNSFETIIVSDDSDEEIYVISD